MNKARFSIIGLLVASSLSISTYGHAGPYPVKVLKTKDGETEVVIVRNEGYAPVEVNLKVFGEGFQSSEQWPITARLPPLTEESVARLYPVKSGKPMFSSVSFTFLIGDRQAKINQEFNYLLPFRDGTILDVVDNKGPGFLKGHASPSVEHAIDFGVPTGKIVTAARDGVVIKTRNDNPSGIAEFGVISSDQIEIANHVMILHDDASIGFYAHLYNGSLEVSEGMRVQAGQKIGLAGSVTNSRNNFIHFAVMRTTESGLVTIPVKFRDPYRNVRLDLRNGEERIRVGTRDEGTQIVLMDRDRKAIKKVVQQVSSGIEQKGEKGTSKQGQRQVAPRESAKKHQEGGSGHVEQDGGAGSGSESGVALLGMAMFWGLIFFGLKGVKGKLDSLLKMDSGQDHREEPKTKREEERREKESETIRREKNEERLGKDGLSLNYELLEIIEWRRFEELVAEYYRLMGFVVEMNSFGPDGGIDVKVKDMIRGDVIAIQCKSWKSMVGVKVVRELFGAMKLGDFEKGEIHSRSGFSMDAMAEAEKLGIKLVSGKKLIHLMGQLPASERDRLFEVATEGDYRTPSCATCGAKMSFYDKKPSFWMCGKHTKSKIYTALG